MHGALLQSVSPEISQEPSDTPQLNATKDEMSFMLNRHANHLNDFRPKKGNYVDSAPKDSRVLHVPRPLKLELGDFVEFKVGRPPENDDGGRLNTVTRVVAKQGDKLESCWWDPRNDRLWQRVVYCDWMSKEGWVKQGGVSPAWYKPAR